MLTLKPLSPAELDDFYPLLQEHFPPSELKKLPHFHQLIDEGVYEMWKLTEEDTVRGLALFILSPGARYAFLDYLMMIDKGRGYGTACLEELKKIYPQGILLETEALLEELPPETLALRKRRQAFYTRSGWRPHPFRNRIWGEVFLLHLWAPEQPEQGAEVCAHEMYLAYKVQNPSEARFNANVFIQGYCKEEDLP